MANVIIKSDEEDTRKRLFLASSAAVAKEIPIVKTVSTPEEINARMNEVKREVGIR